MEEVQVVTAQSFADVGIRLGLKPASETRDGWKDAIFAFRREQSVPSRLCEYITGIRLEDPRLIDRLREDQEIVRAKYGLPSLKTRFLDCGGYEHYMLALAKRNGIDVRAYSDTAFSKTSLLGGAVYLGAEDGMINTIAVDIDRSSEKRYRSSLSSFEHELIHALQEIKYPGMPIEGKEYEAYLASWSIDKISSDFEILLIAFDFGLFGSVNSWYKERELKPVWKERDFFLREIDRLIE
jgi:hypothetical protein